MNDNNFRRRLMFTLQSKELPTSSVSDYYGDISPASLPTITEEGQTCTRTASKYIKNNTPYKVKVYCDYAYVWASNGAHDDYSSYIILDPYEEYEFEKYNFTAEVYKHPIQDSATGEVTERLMWWDPWQRRYSMDSPDIPCYWLYRITKVEIIK